MNRLFKHLNDLKVSFKLYMLTLCFVIGFILFSLVFTSTMNTVRIQGSMYNNIVKSKDLVADILPPPEYIIESDLLLFQALAETDNSKIKEIEGKFTKLKNDFFVRHEFWSKEVEDVQMKELIVTTSYRPAKLFYETAEKEFFPALLSGDRIKAEVIANNTLKVLYEEHRSAIDKLVKIATENSEIIEKKAASTISERFLYLAFIGIAIVVITCILCFLIIKQLLEQLGGEPSEVLAITHEIANGNLMVQFDTNRKKRGIYSGIQDMNEKLKSIVSSIIYAAENITNAGQQISVTTQQISNGANEQASSVEEISSSTEQMSSNIQQNAENAKNAVIIATEAVKKMKQSDTAIKSSIQSIKDIARKISIIGDIAFQTNILSLNASVEAARAGEHGRGFAVVATEVRKLAELSRIASNEMNGLSNKGVVTAENAGKQFIEVIPEISNTAKTIHDISEASNEIDAGIEQINNSIQLLNQLIQQNASAAEELATSAEEMLNQAEEMKEMVSFFKTGVLKG